MAPGKTTNEYCRYLFEPWDCLCTRIARHGQIRLQDMYATGPTLLYQIIDEYWPGFQAGLKYG